MTFGIDLGTTNSLIGRGETLYTGLVSSNVDIAHRKQVPRDYVSSDVIASYKTDMTIGSTGALPVACSTVILEELARLASRRSGEDVKDVVISIPAYFADSQRTAVKKAASDAGLNVKALINEPTAAAIYVCKDLKDLVVVYDLGGGTFDVSIVDSRTGSYHVIATDGLVLGGDDLDCYLVEMARRALKIKERDSSSEQLMRMKFKMRLAKEEIQKTKADVFVDFNEFGGVGEYKLTLDAYRDAVAEVFGKTITMTNDLISAKIPSSEQPKIIFVGGSSACPILREILHEEIDFEELPNTAQPDYIVACGAAMYAKMVDDGVAADLVTDVTKQLGIEDEYGKMIPIVKGNSIIPCSYTHEIFNTDKTSVLLLRLYQGENLLARDNTYIGTLEYQYDSVMEPKEGIVEVKVQVDSDGLIHLSAYEILYGPEFEQTVILNRGDI